MYRRASRRGERVIRVPRDWRGLPGLYQAYYSLHPPLEEPPEVQRREFAFQYFDSESYVRHLSFNSIGEVVEHLAERPARHAYYSIAVYELPEARNMEEKGFLHAPLFFDIDVDHLQGCESPLPSRECLLRGLEAVAKLTALLRRDMGVGEVEAYYTGNRGFHVIAHCNLDCEELGREERREIAWYVLAEALDPEALFPRHTRGYQPAAPDPEDPGWRGWIARRLPPGPPGLVDRLGEAWRERLLELAGEARVPIDPQVTPDTSRLSRIRGSLNGKASLLVTRIGEGWMPDPARLSPFQGELAVRCGEDLEGDVLGYSLGLLRGEEASLPAPVAVLLYTKGLCEITGGEVVVRAGPGWRPL